VSCLLVVSVLAQAVAGDARELGLRWMATQEATQKFALGRSRFDVMVSRGSVGPSCSCRIGSSRQHSLLLSGTMLLPGLALRHSFSTGGGLRIDSRSADV
jgi:hypothetical protein